MFIRPPRLRFEGIERTYDELQGLCSIAVNLSFEKKPFRGEAHGKAGEDNELELTANAVLRAVETFVQPRFTCCLLEVDQGKSLGAELIVLLVNITYQVYELQVFGSCRVNDSLLDAVARAALDATNRYVELTLTDYEAAGTTKNSYSATNLTC